MNLADVIKKCSLEAFDASIPCEVVLGIIRGVEPCEVLVGDMILTEDVLCVAKHLIRREIEIALGVYERTIVINEGLSVGDNVALMRKKGGETYVLFAVL